MSILRHPRKRPARYRSQSLIGLLLSVTLLTAFLTASGAGIARAVEPCGVGFPTSTWKSTNYFVDVEFTAS